MWGPYEEDLRQIQKKGKYVKALEEKPEPTFGGELAWQGFWELHISRQAAFDILPLSTQDILAWLDIYNIEGDERVETFQFIQLLDVHWMKQFHEERERKKRSKGK